MLPMHRDPEPHRDPEAGFTVVAILLLVSVMASVAATFSRHVIVDVQATVVSDVTQDSMALLDTQLEYAFQSQRLGRGVAVSDLDGAVDSGVVGSSESSMDRTTQDLALGELSEDGTRARLFTRALGDGGQGATRLIETVRVPVEMTTAPDQLPGLDADLAREVLGNAKFERMDITTDTTLTGVDFTGVIVVHEAAVLTLDDVTIHGTILSSAAADGAVDSSFSAFLAPRVVVTGPSRIESADFFPGLAVLMPDGLFYAEQDDSRVYVKGDMIAFFVGLRSVGSVDGHIVTVEEPYIASAVRRPGSGREPRAWSTSLDLHGAWTPQFVAVVPRVVTLEESAAILAYTFPVKTSSDPGKGGKPTR